MKNRAAAAGKIIKIDLGPQRASLQRRLQSGRYGDASEVVREALRALDREDDALDQILRDEIKASMADKRRSVPADVVFRRLQAHHDRKIRAAKRGT